ncbi:hypothetical protein [Photobacterium damselae]|uniref:hypothetical protein n=1 Tax=Photobacterium damselae TaxID=38293 RepID=UPI00083A3193|nr:hypothetical protein [Photobacterium damselae]ODA23111.1 hypothetical protein A0J46_18210 [Photobacterium damselae subsp. damselae]
MNYKFLLLSTSLALSGCGGGGDTSQQLKELLAQQIAKDAQDWLDKHKPTQPDDNKTAPSEQVNDNKDKSEILTPEHQDKIPDIKPQPKPKPEIKPQPEPDKTPKPDVEQPDKETEHKKHQITVRNIGPGAVDLHHYQHNDIDGYLFPIKLQRHASIESITGCGGQVFGNYYQIKKITQSCDITAKFTFEDFLFEKPKQESKQIIQQNEYRLSLPVKLATLPEQYIDLLDIQPIQDKSRFGFNDIRLSSEQQQFYIDNQTPTTLKTLLVRFDHNKLIKLHLNEPLVGFSSARFVMPAGLYPLKEAHVVNQAHYFSPDFNLRMDGDIQPCASLDECALSKQAQQQKIVTAMLSVIHDIANRRDFYLAYQKASRNACLETEDAWCRTQATKHQLNPIDASYFAFGYDDYDLAWRTYHDDYQFDALTKGGNSHSNNSSGVVIGHGLVKAGLLSKPFSHHLYQVLTTETAAASGLDSMASQRLGQTMFGYLAQHSDALLSQERPVYQIPAIYLQQEMIAPNKVKIKFVSTEQMVSDNIQLRFMSKKPLSYIVEYDKDSAISELTITFNHNVSTDEQSSDINGDTETELFVQAFSTEDDNPLIATLKIMPAPHQK